MKFKEKDRVKLISGRHGDSKYNPVWGGSQGYIAGTVTQRRPENVTWPLRVNWDYDGEFENSYTDSDLEIAEETIEVGDTVKYGETVCIVRHIGKLDGFGDANSIWGVWGADGDSKWDGLVVPQTEGGQLAYSERSLCKIVKKGKGAIMGKYEEIKRRIMDLNNGWDKKADDILTGIGISCNIEISIQSGGAGVISVESGVFEKSFGKEFIFSSNQCNRMKAFKESLLYILDKSDIKKVDEKEEKWEELQAKRADLQSQIDEISRLERNL